MRGRLVVISPCRDEAEYMRRTLDAIVAQTRRPDLWVIVDDGSTDATPEILSEYAGVHPWIRVLTRENTGERRVGPGVIDAFYAGLDTVNLEEFTHVCKLDLDLDIPPVYFERLLDRMASDVRLGTCSGKPYFCHPGTGKLVSEGCGDDMSVGMIKLFRTDCFRQIGGFVREVMWDGIDCHRCRMLGWRAESYDEPEIRFIHLRPMGSSHRGILTGRMRHGRGQYFMGTGPLFMASSALLRCRRYPVVVGGLAMLLGYTVAMLAGQPRYADPAFRRFLRQYQRRCLLMGKRRAISAMATAGGR